MKIHGITIKPRWPWTKEYRQHAIENLRWKPARRSRNDYEKSAVRYARWLAARDGVSLCIEEDDGWTAEANHTNIRWDWIKTPGTTLSGHIVAVEFYYAEFRRDWSNEPTEKTLITTIAIPNHDHEPEAAETPASPDSMSLAFAA